MLSAVELSNDILAVGRLLLFRLCALKFQPFQISAHLCKRCLANRITRLSIALKLLDFYDDITWLSQHCHLYRFQNIGRLSDHIAISTLLVLLLASAEISLLQETLLVGLVLLMHLQFSLFILILSLLNQVL